MSIERYMELRSRLAKARAAGVGVAEEDVILDAMDDVWHGLSAAEQRWIRAFIAVQRTPRPTIGASALGAAVSPSHIVLSASAI